MQKEKQISFYDLDDSDDEEFEQKLMSSRPAFDNNEDELMEGPSRPALSNGIQQGSSKIQKDQDKPRILVNRPLLGISYGSDDSEEDEKEQEEETEEAKETKQDFFGLNSPPKRQKLDDNGNAQPDDETPSIFFGEVAPGPARPTKTQMAEIGEMESSQPTSLAAAAPIRPITDQEASRMIYEREMAPFGASTSMAEHAVSGIIDVSVDDALGPNVRQNLLKNLNNKQMAQIALGPLPKLKKNEADKLAKRKHQITHLAQVAVFREEQLQEKWAEGKQNKKMSRQKYGF